ncbi:hypothetical protein KYB31_00775 [Clostridium felsineum]|uniref:hypothetical protein n=1 Tax=Clostridium felsineum TaxID=36839 RepID=UPI00214D82E9|nr:hypothetical protein [Clostridium felsineum]MCR3757523.1 hypothetical protein [Clostridium felsineum]
MISKFKKRTIVVAIVGVLVVAAVGAGVLINEKKLGVDSNKTVETKTNTKITNKEAVSKIDTISQKDIDKKDTVPQKDADKKDSKVGLKTTNPDEKQTNTVTSKKLNVAQNNTKKKNRTASIGSNINRNTLPNSESSKFRTRNSTKINQNEYAAQQAAIAAINYEENSSKISSVKESQGGDGYANFSDGDIGATVFTNTVTKNGKECYTIRLGSKSMRANGGTGTIDILYVAKDGTVYRNN